MGAAAKVGLILAMVALVLGAQLLEGEMAVARHAELEARRASGAGAERIGRSPGAPPLAALLAPLDDVRLPDVPRRSPGSLAGIPDGEEALRAAGGARIYVVRPGDTLARIARRVLGRESAWQAIFEANRKVIPDPARLQVGVSLRIPAAEPRPEPARAVDNRRGIAIH